jgi:hypothetical protein
MPIPPDLGPKFLEIKKSLVAPANRDKVTASWKRLLRTLSTELAEIDAQGSSYVPKVDWNNIVLNNYQLPRDVEEKFKQRGVIMVENLIDEPQIDLWFNELVDFCKKNPQTAGYTYPNPTSWYNVFWTKPQTEARFHPNMQKLMSVMGKQFHVSNPDCLMDLKTQVTYGDRIRIRYPGAAAALPLHLDSSSIERWEDKTYRSVYKEIFEGDWENWDPFKLDERAYANENLYQDSTEARDTICSSFRTLQGWLALSDNKTGEGTLRVLPNIKLTMAYIMLRPLFWKDPESGNIDDYEMDLETSKFPGARPSTGQLYIPDEFFHHLNQAKSVVGIPDVKKGSFVFWHADLPHEVDKEHNGNGHSSVFYYAQSPLSVCNINTLLDTKNSFSNNASPTDYCTQLTPEQMEQEYQGADRSHIPNDEGLRSMGLMSLDTSDPSLTQGQRKIREMANQALKTNKFAYDHI